MEIVSGGVLEGVFAFGVETSVIGVTAVETVESEIAAFGVSSVVERLVVLSEEVSKTVLSFCAVGSSVSVGSAGSASRSEVSALEESEETSESVLPDSCAGTSDVLSSLGSVSVFGVEESVGADS